MKTPKMMLDNLMNERATLSAGQFSRAVRLVKLVAKETGRSPLEIFADYGWNFNN